MKPALALIAMLTVAAATVGCASEPKSTGVVTVAPDTYRVTARGKLGVPAESRKEALSEADRFCAEKGGSMQVTETGKAPLTGPFEVTFQCPPDEPEGAARPATHKPASAVPFLR